MEQFDVAVIGSGPGGYVAAVRAAHLGLKTVLIEKDKRLGGTCLLRGCIPTKSLLHSADLLSSFAHAKDHGILADNVRFDFSQVQKAREKVVTKSAAGVDYLMKSNKITVIKGHGRIKGPHAVEVTTEQGVETVHTRFIVLATGSVPRTVPSIPINGTSVVTSDTLLELSSPPASLMVLGAGAVGVEFASVYSRFGSKVTLVEMQQHLLPIEDREVSQELEKLLKKRGIVSHTQTKIEKVETTSQGVKVTLSKQDKVWTEEASMLLCAIGRAPVTQDVGLNAVGIQADSGGYIPVDTYMHTQVPSIYAIGDIVRTPQLAHIASAEALLAIDHLAGKHAEPLNYGLTPSCTYCDPEVASVGLTEHAAREKGYQVKVGKFPFSALGKARIMSAQPEGFVKIVAESTYDEILGIHIIGARATDMIAEACVAMRLESTTLELAHTVHAHPTLPEAVLEAAHAALGRPIHL
jgi:dihydrolipoamide dehydrogenase